MIRPADNAESPDTLVMIAMINFFDFMLNSSIHLFFICVISHIVIYLRHVVMVDCRWRIVQRSKQICPDIADFCGGVFYAADDILYMRRIEF